MAGLKGDTEQIEFQKLLQSDTATRIPVRAYGDERVLNVLCRALLGAVYDPAVSQVYPNLTLYSSTNKSVTLGIIPLDFYAWNLWQPGDPIACCVTGTSSENTFYSLARSRLRNASESITIERSDKSEATFHLQISTTKIQLRYHPNPLIARWSEITEEDAVEARDNLPWRSQERFAELERTQDVASQLKGHTGWPTLTSYSLYEKWARNLGLYGNVLSREHLLGLARYALYVRVDSSTLNTLDLPLPEEPQDVEETCNDLGLQGIKIKQPAWQIMTHLVGAARQNLKQEDGSSVINFNIPQWPLFFQLQDRFVRVDVSYWGSSGVTAAKYRQAVERAIRLGILRGLQKSQPKHAFHFWPQAFRESEIKRDAVLNPSNSLVTIISKYRQLLKIGLEDEAETQSEHDARENPQFNSCYFIGYTYLTTFVEENALSDEFVNERFRQAFDWEDMSSCFVQISKIHQDQLPEDLTPYKSFPLAIPEDIRKLAIEDSEDEANPEDNEAPSPSTSPTRAPKKPTKPRSKNRDQQSHNADNENADAPTAVVKSTFLRPASDVLHRIRHDSTFKPDDVLIGYLDRHTGIREIPFDWWTEEKTAEEFIPQSRIRYFKRKSDGVVLWGREARIDLVFGTGR